MRAVSPDDEAWLLALRLATMSDYIERSGETLTLEDQRDRVLHDYEQIRIVQLAGDPVGMLKVVRGADCWRLVQLQLLPEHQGDGVGTVILRDLLEQAHAAGVPVCLSVLKVNPARRLYERLGFTVVSEGERSFRMRWAGGQRAGR